MKTKNILCRNISKDLKNNLLVLGVLFMFITINSCIKDDNTDEDSNDSITYSLSDMLGTWQRHSLVTDNNNNGFWIYGTITNDDVSSTIGLTLPNGSWDTVYYDVNASISPEGVLTTIDDPFAHSYLSADKNLIVGTTVRNSMYTLVIDQKALAGTNYGSSDLQGTWHTHYLVGGGSWTGWVHATSTIGSSGDYTIDNIVKSDGNSAASTGTFSISADGFISVEEVTTYNGFMNPDKNLMVTNMTDGGGGGGLAVAQKVIAGTSYSITDLEGTWQLHDIIVGSENWTEHGMMTIDANGNGLISDMIRDDGVTFNNPGSIQMAISTEGILTFSPDFHGFMSADKKLIFGTRGDATNAYSLLVLQKMP